MSFGTFVRSRTFLKHFLLAIAVVLFFFWIIFRMLGNYTSHGELIKVPDFTGVNMEELDKFVEGKNIRYEVVDSVYDMSQKPGVVIKQDPSADSEVKHNRTIYLYVTSKLPQQIQMPKLVDRSLRQASVMIDSYGLKLGNQTYITDQCTNCVLKQMMKGKVIEPGTLIPKNTVIDLVIGKGLTSQYVSVPYLVGMTREQALEKLAENSLKEGEITFDGKADSLKARVYKQMPSASKDNSILLGSGIDLSYTTNPDKIPLELDSASVK